MPYSIVIGSIGWADKVNVRGQIRTSQVLSSMVLNPILLIDCIVTPVGRVTDVEVELKPAIEGAQRV